MSVVICVTNSCPMRIFINVMGALTCKWGTAMCVPARPLFKLLLPFTNVIFCLQNQTFLENTAIYSSKSSNLALSFVKKLENVVNLNCQAPVFERKSAQKTLLSWQFTCSQAPRSEMWATNTYPKKKVECPPNVIKSRKLKWETLV